MKKAVALVVLALVLLIFPRPASAHAILIACVPRVGSNISKPPAQLICQFNEPLDPTKISLVVTDAQGARVDKGDTRFFEGDPQTLVVSLDAAKMHDGIFTAQWAVTDTLDGGATSGQIQFGINTPVPPTPTPALPGAPMTPTPVQTGSAPSELISRFLIGLGVVVLLAVVVLFWRMRSAAQIEE